MWQRKQTIYMLAVVAFMTAMCFTPLARYMVDGNEGAFVAFDYWWFGGLVALAALVPFVSIFLFKNRLAQIRLLVADVVLLLGAQGFALWYAIGFKNVATTIGEVGVGYLCTPVVYPLICILWVVMAIRAIWKDEMLVRSLNRIR